jgi:hypothetical protein
MVQSWSDGFYEVKSDELDGLTLFHNGIFNCVNAT